MRPLVFNCLPKFKNSWPDILLQDLLLKSRIHSSLNYANYEQTQTITLLSQFLTFCARFTPHLHQNVKFFSHQSTFSKGLGNHQSVCFCWIIPDLTETGKACCAFDVLAHLQPSRWVLHALLELFWSGRFTTVQTFSICVSVASHSFRNSISTLSASHFAHRLFMCP